MIAFFSFFQYNERRLVLLLGTLSVTPGSDIGNRCYVIKGKNMKRSVLIYVVMAFALLVILRAPFMPYVQSELLAAYLDYDYLTAVGLVQEMYILHTLPGSVSFFGYDHYATVTMLFVILGVVMIILPVALELISMAILVLGKKDRIRRVGIVLAVATVVLFFAYLIVFFGVGTCFLGIATKPGYGVYVAFAASVVFAVGAFLQRQKEN